MAPANPVPGLNKETKVVTVLGTARPVVSTVMKDIFRAKEYKLRDIAKMMGIRPSQAFRTMYNRNQADNEVLDDHIKEVGEGVWEVDLKPIITEDVVTPDVTRPVVVLAEGIGNTLVITFNDANHLNSTKIPSTNKISVMVNGKRVGVSKILIPKNTNIMKIMISTQVKFGDAIAVAYEQPESINNQIQDMAGNIVANFACDVTNTTTNPNPAPPADNTPPPAAPEGDGGTNPLLP